MNNVVLEGRLVANPELKTTDTGVEVVNFRIAVNKDYVKPGEERQADFINIVAWRKTAAFICQYFKKGDGIALVGRIQTRTYKTDGGEDRYVFEIVADKVEFPSGKKTQTSDVAAQNENQHTTIPQDNNTASKLDELNSMTDEPPTSNDDDLPF